MAITFKKRIISFILIPVLVLTITFCNVHETKAVVGSVLGFLGVVTAVTVAVESSSTYQDWYQNSYRPKWRETCKELFQLVGVPADYTAIFDYYGPDPIQEIRLWMAEKTNTDPSQITDEQCIQSVYNMYDNSQVNSNNDSFSMSGDLNSFTQYLIDKFTSDTGYTYVYTTPLSYRLNDFVDGTKYNAVRQFLNEHPNSVIELSTQQGYDGLFLFDNSADIGLIKGLALPQSVNCVPYSISTWSEYTGIAYEYSNGEFIEKRADLPGSYLDEWYRFNTEYGNDNLSVGSGIALSKDVMTFVMFTTLADLKRYSVGELPYYINNSVYNDYSQSTGDYVITTDNSNKISYGDITSYVDSFNQQNGEYPTPNDIQVFIDNNIPPSSGGGGGNGGTSGSGTVSVVNNNNPVNNNNVNVNFVIPGLSGNSVSGNGTGESNGISNIFGFLSQIGHVIGDLIKNIGQVLADILEGIVSVVSDLLESIPTVFGDFMGALIGWLPPELQALITLSITAMIIVGLIKLFKG